MDNNAVISYQLGDFLVTTLHDGDMSVSLHLLSGIELAEANKRGTQERIQINSYLIRAPGQTILVDAGIGSVNNGQGQVVSRIRALGVKPEEIDKVLLTHGHPDHIGGLLDAQGEPVYPQAELYLHSQEQQHWLSERHYNRANARSQANFLLMRRTLAAYAGKVRTFADGQFIAGIRAIWLPGHTPGHSGFCLHAAEEKLLIWGDIVHFPSIQSAYPSLSIVFDWDALQAEKTRQEILLRAVQEKLLIAGMHLDSPGFARVQQANIGYRLVYQQDCP